jgi:hypothetical protein
MKTIDKVLDFVKDCPGLSEIEREVLRTRISSPPSTEEINQARQRLTPFLRSTAWDTKSGSDYV